MANALLAEIFTAPDLPRFLSARLFDATPSVFGGDHDAWVNWRAELASKLGVDDHGVLLVGSAAFGMSLSPAKEFREFGPHSDVDVAVVSPRHFDVAWFELRDMRSNRWQSLPSHFKRELLNYTPNYVFFGSIATDKVLGRLSFGKQWTVALNDMASVSPTLDRRINVRVYRDPEALRTYQLLGLKKAKEALLSAGGPPA